MWSTISLKPLSPYHKIHHYDRNEHICRWFLSLPDLFPSLRREWRSGWKPRWINSFQSLYFAFIFVVFSIIFILESTSFPFQFICFNFVSYIYIWMSSHLNILSSYLFIFTSCPGNIYVLPGQHNPPPRSISNSITWRTMIKPDSTNKISA